MSKSSGVKGATIEQVSRKKRVITMLEAQLKRGTKNQRIVNDNQEVPLTDKDIIRIKKELETLKTRI